MEDLLGRLIRAKDVCEQRDEWGVSMEFGRHIKWLAELDEEVTPDAERVREHKAYAESALEVFARHYE